LEKIEQRKGKDRCNEAFRSFTEWFQDETTRATMIDQDLSEKTTLLEIRAKGL